MAEATIRSVAWRDASISRTAHVSDHAIVGAPAEHRSELTTQPAIVCSGSVVREFAVVHAGLKRLTVIGAGTLVLTGAYVGHDVQTGEGCEIAPHAVLLGHVTLGARVKVGAGAVILPGVTIGDEARIGAGAVVTKNVPAGETWAGVPAQGVR